jgi:hypothetical protein
MKVICMDFEKHCLLPNWLIKLSEKDKSYAVPLYGNELRTESRIHDWIYV